MPPILRIEVSALVAVILAAVFLFLGRTQIGPDLPMHQVDLPKAQHPAELRAANSENAMLVKVTLDGKLFFGADRVEADQLPDLMQQSMKHGAEPRVYVMADQRVKYQAVTEVIDAAHDAGIVDVSFLASETPRAMPDQ